MRTNTFLTILFGSLMAGTAIIAVSDQPEIIEESTIATDAIVEVSKPSVWQAPDESLMPANEKEMILYGKELIKNTSLYLGPKGTVASMSNGMNCQNCHLDAGAKAWGNNYSAVASTYPKFRERSGAEEDIPKRVNDCFERSLNGKALPEVGKEMQAIVSYINFLGTNVQKGDKPEGSGITEVLFLDRAADPEKGKLVYQNKCVSCHMVNGEGMANADKTGYTYPPLWGDHSYNDGAGLFRLSRFAGYVKSNMPLGVNYENPQLTDEEAWDVAAYVNSQARPKKNIKKDWPNIAGKPIDHPFGPFHDGFSEEQHKYGPFKPIKEKRAELKKEKSKKV